MAYCEAEEYDEPCNPFYVPWRSTEIVIYTDGACSNNQYGRNAPKKASWAFVALHNDPKEGYSKIKSYYGLVETDEDEKYFIGAEYSTNNTAELSAIGRAYIYLLTLLRLHKQWRSNFKRRIKDIKIVTDSKYAIGVLDLGHTPTENKILIRTLKRLRKKLNRYSVTVTFEHVFGHNGDYFNELADNIATAVIGCDCSDCTP